MNTLLHSTFRAATCAALFGDSGGVGLNQTRLIIDTVPEPSATALFLPGSAFYLRRRPLRTHKRNT